jgi:hypothetical protein
MERTTIHVMFEPLEIANRSKNVVVPMETHAIERANHAVQGFIPSRRQGTIALIAS